MYRSDYEITYILLPLIFHIFFHVSFTVFSLPFSIASQCAKPPLQHPWRTCKCVCTCVSYPVSEGLYALVNFEPKFVLELRIKPRGLFLDVQNTIYFHGSHKKNKANRTVMNVIRFLCHQLHNNCNLSDTVNVNDTMQLAQLVLYVGNVYIHIW